MPNVSETMASVRWLLQKYSWMSASNDMPLPKRPEDRYHHLVLTEEEKENIISLSNQGVKNRKIASITGRSHTTINNVLKKHRLNSTPTRTT
jgi:DNA-binding NarL/FixJ family response regulator